jgi:hypothetical protein
MFGPRLPRMAGISAPLVFTIPTRPEPERRHPHDRRQRHWYGVLAGHWLRRRTEPRRPQDAHVSSTDWHDSHWLAVAVLIIVLSIMDAFMTLTLLPYGAREANPFMAKFVHGSGHSFAYWKLGLTVTGVVMLVALARVRLFGWLRAGLVLYAVLALYVGLVIYEWQMLQHYENAAVSYWQSIPLDYRT